MFTSGPAAAKGFGFVTVACALALSACSDVPAEGSQAAAGDGGGTVTSVQNALGSTTIRDPVHLCEISPCLCTSEPCLDLGEASARAFNPPLYGDLWEVYGFHFARDRSDVQVRIEEVGPGVTLELVSGVVTNGIGTFSMRGATHVVPGSGLFPTSTMVDHPLQCGRSYQAISFDPQDGWVYSKVFETSPCPIIR